MTTERYIDLAYAQDSDTNIPTSAEDVEVISPTAVVVNFVFTALSPDTTSMRLAVQARLQQLFAEEVEFGATLISGATRSFDE